MYVLYNFSVYLKFFIIKGWDGRMCLPFDPAFHDPVPHPAICLEMRMIDTNISLYRGVHHSYICEKFVKTLSSNRKRLVQCGADPY